MKFTDVNAQAFKAAAEALEPIVQELSLLETETPTTDSDPALDHLYDTRRDVLNAQRSLYRLAAMASHPDRLTLTRCPYCGDPDHTLDRCPNVK